MFFSDKIEEGYIDKRDAFVFVKGCPWCKVYSTKVLINPNVRFANLKVNEDLVFTKKAILQCDKIFYLSKPLYMYEDVPTSLMHITKRDPSIYIDAYRMIESEQIADYAEELCAMYALEVIYPTLLYACTNKCNNLAIQELSDKISVDYKNNKYIRQYNFKHRFVLKLIQYRLYIFIKLLLKLC